MIKKSLSPKELECLYWVAVGKTSKEISSLIGLSVHTVNFHLKNVCTKLKAPNRAAAITKAFKANILNANPLKSNGLGANVSFSSNAHYNQSHN